MRPLHEPAKNKEILREMSFLEHLDDLRGVLIRSLVAFVALSVGYWFVSARVMDFLIADLPVDHLNFFSPSEAFMTRMKISFVLGLMTAFPYILFLTWRFVSPGLFANERKTIYPFVVSASALFYAGVIFCYLVLIPVVIEFLLGFGTERLTPLLSVSAYFAMVARLSFTFGIVFQLPLIVLVLALVGIITPEMLLRQWRYAVVIVFVVSAVLTPPDPVSQVLMAGPVLLLYAVSVFLAYVVVRRRNRREDQ